MCLHVHAYLILQKINFRHADLPEVKSSLLQFVRNWETFSLWLKGKCPCSPSLSQSLRQILSLSHLKKGLPVRETVFSISQMKQLRVQAIQLLCGRATDLKASCFESMAIFIKPWMLQKTENGQRSALEWFTCESGKLESELLCHPESCTEKALPDYVSRIELQISGFSIQSAIKSKSRSLVKTLIMGLLPKEQRHVLIS